jgi:hypothetical protein
MEFASVELASSNSDDARRKNMLIPTDAQRLTFAYDPRGILDTVTAPIAPRPKTLKGLRLGVLDNSKWNANKLLRGATVALGETNKFGDIRYYVKHSFSKDAVPELIAEIAERCDIVLTAIGDCGSCTSCCVRDAIALEKLGVPTAAIVTTEFVRETELQRRALGMDDLLPVIIKHPVSSITDDEVSERVEQISVQSQMVWLGQLMTGSGASFKERIAANIGRAMYPDRDEASMREALAFAVCQP